MREPQTGADDAVLELSDECANCIRLTGEVYGGRERIWLAAIGL